MIKDTIANLERLKAEIEWDKDLSYQKDLDEAIRALKDEEKYEWHYLYLTPNDYPKKDTHYLIAYIDEDGDVRYDVAWYDRFYKFDYYTKHYEVLAWKKLEEVEA